MVFQDELRDAVLAVEDRLPGLRTTVVADGKTGHGVDRTIDQLLDQPDAEPDVEVEEPVGGAGIMYISGTTGPPKGVVATKYDTGPMQLLLQASGMRPGETMYTALPLFHANALLVSMLGSMVLDAKFALGEKFSGSRFFEECRKHETVEFNTLGAMIPILLKQPPRPGDRDHPVRVVVGASCPPEIWEEFERRFGVRIVEWFGMADAPGILMNDAGKVGAMGKPIAGVEFRVVDENEEELPQGEVGELVFRHPQGQLTHYHKVPEATKEAYRSGWFHSGDLAVMDGEGFYYHKGRKKESIRRRGENISAWEIESVINQHPAVRESAAYGLPSELGEHEVKVEVVLKPGTGLSIRRTEKASASAYMRSSRAIRTRGAGIGLSSRREQDPCARGPRRASKGRGCRPQCRRRVRARGPAGPNMAQWCRTDAGPGRAGFAEAPRREVLG